MRCFGKPAALLLPALLLLGCGGPSLPLQTVPLAGSAAEIGQFEGRWFDEEGVLIAVVSSRLSVRLPSWFNVRDAGFQDGRLIFHVKSEGVVSPFSVLFALEGEDRLASTAVVPSEARTICCVCGNPLEMYSGIVLVRNPSPVWHARRSARHASEWIRTSYRKAYDAFWDRLSRIV